MKIPHILVNSANVLHILPILVNSAMLVNSASINMQYYEYFAYTNGDVTGVQGPLIEAQCLHPIARSHGVCNDGGPWARPIHGDEYDPCTTPHHSS